MIRNSRPPNSFSHAKLETFLSKIEQPAIITLSSVNDILLKFLPNLIKIRFWIFSEINKFDPAPMIKKLLLFLLIYKRKSLNSDSVSGTKKLLRFHQC